MFNNVVPIPTCNSKDIETLQWQNSFSDKPRGYVTPLTEKVWIHVSQGWQVSTNLAIENILDGKYSRAKFVHVKCILLELDIQNKLFKLSQ